MTILQALYEKQEQLEGRSVTGVASSMARHQKLAELQREIDYYELGDTISKSEIQKELAEIELLQVEINRLTAVVTERRSISRTKLFGAHSGV